MIYVYSHADLLVYICFGKHCAYLLHHTCYISLESTIRGCVCSSLGVCASSAGNSL